MLWTRFISVYFETKSEDTCQTGGDEALVQDSSKVTETEALDVQVHYVLIQICLLWLAEYLENLEILFFRSDLPWAFEKESFIMTRLAATFNEESSCLPTLIRS